MGISSFVKGEVNRKISRMKEDWRRKKEEDDAYRNAIHNERIASAPTKAKAIEKVRLQQEIKDIKRSGGKGGGRQILKNFAANMSDPNFGSGSFGGGGVSGGGNMDWVFGDMGGGSRRSGKKHRRSKARTAKAKSNKRNRKR